MLSIDDTEEEDTEDIFYDYEEDDLISLFENLMDRD